MAILINKLNISIEDFEEESKKYDFSNIQLEQELASPNMLRFDMQGKNLIESQNEVSFNISNKLIGKKVDICIQTIRKDVDKKISYDNLIFSGFIFNVNLSRSNIKSKLTIEVTVYSPDYFLNDTPHCGSFENRKLKNIVGTKLGSYDISVKNEPDFEKTIPYTVQYNETNYEFIRRLAFRYGQWFYYDGSQVVFGKVEKSKSLDLMHGNDILSYQYRLDMEHQNFTHSHYDYLHHSHHYIYGRDFSNQNMHSLTDIAYEKSRELYKTEPFEHLKASSPENGSFYEDEETYYREIELSAKIKGLGKKAQMMLCFGTSNRADLTIGSVFKMKEIFEEEKKGGTYYHEELMVCKITHVVDNMGNYENSFVAIPANCEVPPYNYGEHFPKAETQPAIVKDNKDPECLGRVRVQFFWQSFQDELTPWIRIAQPHGGSYKGFNFVPEIDEDVMVGFENGNAEKPYVIGTLYRFRAFAPGDGDISNDTKTIRTRNGHTIEFTDSGKNGKICIYDSVSEVLPEDLGSTTFYSTNFKTYKLEFSTDQQLIKLESKGNIELYAGGDIVLNAGESIVSSAGKNIVSTAGNDINEEAKNDIFSRSGNNININAAADMLQNITGDWLAISGSYAELQADAELLLYGKSKVEVQSPGHISLCESPDIILDANSSIKLDASSEIEEKAPNIKINADGQLEAKGGIVKIN